MHPLRAAAPGRLHDGRTRRRPDLVRAAPGLPAGDGGGVRHVVWHVDHKRGAAVTDNGFVTMECQVDDGIEVSAWTGP
jgi:hypothetical protein